ncbi:hypothetical protein [Phytoactinopolyspora alkaliphila]|nr:hypothetical protein [Phytoactinopolyspora alkaliphila]
MRYAHHGDVPEVDIDPDHVDREEGEHLPPELLPTPTDEADQ